MAFGEVALADAVDTVRRELEEAINRGEGSSVAFEAGPVKMEFEVDFTTTGGGEAGLKVWVVSIGAKGEVQRSSTNRLTIELQPVDRIKRTKSLIGDVGTE